MNELLATIVEANEYFEFKVGAEDWLNASDNTKTKCLVTATRQIANLRFKGVKTDKTQALPFPRGGSTTIPNNIKFACCEIAIVLLRELDMDIEYENISMTKQRYGAVESSYDKDNPPIYIQAGIACITAWRFLTPYLHDWKRIRIVQ